MRYRPILFRRVASVVQRTNNNIIHRLSHKFVNTIDRSSLLRNFLKNTVFWTTGRRHRWNKRPMFFFLNDPTRSRDMTVFKNKRRLHTQCDNIAVPTFFPTFDKTFTFRRIGETGWKFLSLLFLFITVVTKGLIFKEHCANIWRCTCSSPTHYFRPNR